MELASNLESVRKAWLKSWQAVLGYHIAGAVVCLLLSFTLGWENGGKDLFLGFLRSLFAILWSVLCYKCAYEKPGTKLLTFLSVLCGLGVLGKLSSLSQSDFSIYEIVDYLIFFPVFIWYIITSINLRSENKKIVEANKQTEDAPLRATDIHPTDQ